jgi:hypothetical protein
MSIIDGAANALVRMDGSREAAEFLYRVADRLVAGAREPTPLPQALLPAPKAQLLIREIEEILEETKVEPLPRLLQPRRDIALQWFSYIVAALVVAFAVTPWR